jgi:hypothetical protein
MANGASVLKRSVHKGRSRLPWYFSWFSGVLDAEMDDARDDSWRGSFAA